MAKAITRAARPTVSATSTLTYASGRTSGGSSVRVAAMSLFGRGKFSEASQPPVAPGKPAVSAVIAGDGELTVKWRAPASNGGAEITSYDVRSILSTATEKSDPFWANVIGAWTAGRLEYTITSLTNGELLRRGGAGGQHPRQRCLVNHGQGGHPRSPRTTP